MVTVFLFLFFFFFALLGFCDVSVLLCLVELWTLYLSVCLFSPPRPPRTCRMWLWLFYSCISVDVNFKLCVLDDASPDYRGSLAGVRYRSGSCRGGGVVALCSCVSRLKSRAARSSARRVDVRLTAEAGRASSPSPTRPRSRNPSASTVTAWGCLIHLAWGRGGGWTCLLMTPKCWILCSPPPESMPLRFSPPLTGKLVQMFGSSTTRLNIEILTSVSLVDEIFKTTIWVSFKWIYF